MSRPMFVDCTTTDVNLPRGQTDTTRPVRFVNQLRKRPALRHNRPSVPETSSGQRVCLGRPKAGGQSAKRPLKTKPGKKQAQKEEIQIDNKQTN